MSKSKRNAPTQRQGVNQMRPRRQASQSRVNAAAGPGGAFAHDPASQIADPRLTPGQRQAAAADIGRRQGNALLQRVLATPRVSQNRGISIQRANGNSHEERLREDDPSLYSIVKEAADKDNKNGLASNIISNYLNPFASNVLRPAIDVAVADLASAQDTTLSEDLLRASLLVGLATLTGGVGAAVGGATAAAISGGLGAAGSEGINKAFSNQASALDKDTFKAKRKKANNEPEKKAREQLTLQFVNANRDDLFRLAKEWKDNTNASSTYAQKAENAYKDNTYDAWINAINERDAETDHGSSTTGRIVIRGLFAGRNFADFNMWGVSGTMDGMDNTGGSNILRRFEQRRLGDMAIQRDFSFGRAVASSLWGKLVLNADGNINSSATSLSGLGAIAQANYSNNDTDMALNLVKIWIDNQTLAGLGGGFAGLSGDASGAGD